MRLIKPEKPEYLVAMRDKTGKPYKSYSAGENAFVEIFETPDGRWRGEAVSVFKANQKGRKPTLAGATIPMHAWSCACSKAI